MVTRQWLIAIPLAAMLVGSTASGSAVRDEARMFSPRAVEQAQARLDRLEKKTHVPVVIETIDEIPGVERTSRQEKLQAVNKLALKRDQQIRDEGIYILMSKRDMVMSEPLIREHLKDVVPLKKRHAIRDAFTEEFKKKDYDSGLMRGVAEIEKTLEGVSIGNHRVGAGAPVPVAPGARRGAAGGGGSMMSTFLLIGLGIFAVLIVLRLLGGLFGRAQGGYNQMGMGGPRPGMGPGGPGYYGGGGYGGGRGGGFFSGLLGGLGGAMAGNWLYDQMSGRHGGMTSAGAGMPGQDASSGAPDAADERIIGADDDGGQGASWDNGGGDTGGGDWGGGDAGGDWGGGGGDWGGGDAGGDWGGGGGGDW